MAVVVREAGVPRGTKCSFHRPGNVNEKGHDPYRGTFGGADVRREGVQEV